MLWRMDFIPSRLPNAQRAVTRQPSRHASPSVSTDIEQSENKSRSESTPEGLPRSRPRAGCQLRDLLKLAGCRRRPTLLTVRAATNLSASKVSAPPYGGREPRRASHNQQTKNGYGSEHPQSWLPRAK